MKTLFAATALLTLCLAGCGGGGNDTATPTPSLLPTVWLPDGTPTTACSLEPLCSGVLPVAGSYRDYRVTRNLDTFILTGPDGQAQTLSSLIHFLRFTDAVTALDTEGPAGQGYRLYQAAFNRVPDLPGLGFWVGMMSKGMTLLDVANAFVQSPEFKSIYGTAPSNTELVTAYYRNALRREPDPAGLAYWVGLLNGGVLTPAQVLVQFSESPENKARVLNAIQFGVTYIPPELVPPPPEAFIAKVSIAPPDRWGISGVVHLEVRGQHLANVELLPAAGYTPRYGVFTVSADGTVASLDFDTRALPNGPVDLRISAFNAPAGDPSAAEIIAMPTRHWDIRNGGTPVPANFSAALTAAPADGAVISGVVHLEVRGTAIGNVELLPPSGYTPRLAAFSVTPDKTLAWLDYDTRLLPDGPLGVRISAFDVPAGTPGATEAVVMPARTWQVRNTSGPVPGVFSAAVATAPADNAAVRGVVRLEVRGSGMRNVELLPAIGYTPRLGVFSITPDGSYAWLDFNAGAFPVGPLDVRISAFNRPAGQPDATEIIAMPARRWQISR